MGCLASLGGGVFRVWLGLPGLTREAGGPKWGSSLTGRCGADVTASGQIEGEVGGDACFAVFVWVWASSDAAL